MNRYLLTAIFLVSALSAFSQGKVAEDIGALLQAGKLAEAEELTNRYLTEDPSNPDAVMMKGNVLLNRYLAEQQALLSVRPDFNEDVFDAGSVKKKSAVAVPDTVARQVAKLWNAALKLDPAREDLHFGLCQLYAIALMKSELLAQMPAAKASAKNPENLHVTFTGYALNLKERGDFEGAVEVLKTVRQMFPNQPGLLSDIAGEYFFAEKTDSARHYLALSVKVKNADEATLGNAFFLYSLLGDYDAALAALRRLPGEGHLLYEGLLKLFSNEKGWQKPVKKFLQTKPDSTDAAAAALLAADTFQVNLDNYLRLAEQDLGDGFKILIHQKFRETGHFLPHFNAAEAFCFHQQHTAAAAVFQKMEQDALPMEPEDAENFNFYFAWTLHQLGQPDDALPRWESLFGSEDFYKQSAAAWFVGKHWFDQGEKAKARGFFARVAGRAGESKFATMCWHLMGEN